MHVTCQIKQCLPDEQSAPCSERCLSVGVAEQPYCKYVRGVVLVHVITTGKVFLFDCGLEKGENSERRQISSQLFPNLRLQWRVDSPLNGFLCPLSWVPPSETELRCHVSEVGETEMHGDVSEFALATSQTTTFNLVGTCFRTNLQLTSDPRVKSTPELNEHRLGMHTPPGSRRPRAATHVSRMQHLSLWSCVGDDPRTDHDRWGQVG